MHRQDLSKNRPQTMLLILLANSAIGVIFFSCGTSNSVQYKCSGATSNSSLVQAVCGTTPSSTPTATPTATATTSPSPTPSVSPSPTPLPTCTYTEQWVFLASTDPSVDFSDTVDPYTVTQPTSDCASVTAGTSTLLNTVSLDRVSGIFTIVTASTTFTLTATGNSLSGITDSTQCISNTLITTHLNAGTVGITPVNTLTLDFLYTEVTGGC